MQRIKFGLLGALLAAGSIQSTLIRAQEASLPSASVATSETARAAIERKDFRGAREIYSQLAAQEPENLEYRVWIGRISGWLQDYPAAQTAYDEVLVRNPQQLEALLGNATVLMWQQKFEAARPFLLRAREVAPENADVRLAWARFYRAQNQEKQALAEVQAILAVDPKNAEALELSKQIELPRPLEFRVGYERSRFSFASSPANHQWVNVGYLGGRGRVDVAAERWQRFGDISTRLALSANRRLNQKWSVRGGVALAPGADVIPRREASLGVAHVLRRNLVVGLDYRYSYLATATNHTLAPTLEYYFKSPSWLQVTYYRSWTSFRSTVARRLSDDSYAIRYNHQVSEPVLLYVGYGKGRESFQTILTPSLDRISSFDATTYLAGAKWQVAKYFWLDIFGVQQRRSTGTRESTLGVSVTTRQ
jgi:YaiO family outer membrane protein